MNRIRRPRRTARRASSSGPSALINWTGTGDNSTKTLICTTLLLGFTSSLFAADPFTGTWRLNTAKSSGTIPKDETLIIQKRGRMLLVEVQVVTGDSARPAFSIKYSVPADGGTGRVEAGPYDGVTLRRLGAKSLEISYLSSGKEARITGVAVSKDGKTMTSTGKALGPGERIEWTMFFEK